jgi:hypothetical protein
MKTLFRVLSIANCALGLFLLFHGNAFAEYNPVIVNALLFGIWAEVLKK